MKHLLFIFFLCLLAHSASSQIVKGLTFGGIYTIQRVSEIHADKEVEVENITNTSRRIKIRLSDTKYHYLMIELRNYNEIKGGQLDRILLSSITLEEADRYFNNWVRTNGEPSRGYEEEETSLPNQYATKLMCNKGVVYFNKRVANDAIAVSVQPTFGDYTYNFEVSYYKIQNSLGNMGNSNSESNGFSSSRWRINRIYGAGSKVVYYK